MAKSFTAMLKDKVARDRCNYIEAKGFYQKHPLFNYEIISELFSTTLGFIRLQDKKWETVKDKSQNDLFDPFKLAITKQDLVLDECVSDIWDLSKVCAFCKEYGVETIKFIPENKQLYNEVDEKDFREFCKARGVYLQKQPVMLQYGQLMSEVYTEGTQVPAYVLHMKHNGKWAIDVAK